LASRFRDASHVSQLLSDGDEFMQEIVDYLGNLPPHYRTATLVVGLIVFWIAEGAVPLFPTRYRRVRHAALNVLLTFFQLVVSLFFAVVTLKATAFTTANSFGLLYVIELPLWLHVVLGVMLLDMIGGYCIHRTEHSIRWMWEFHVIHHSDENIDVTSGLRHHPVETVFRLSSQLLAILLCGIPLGVVFLYGLISIFFAQLTHANISPPVALDRFFSLVFVTPNMHKVHHHRTKPLTNTNYGNVLSIWDRMFGTFAQVDMDTLSYGLDSMPYPEDHLKLSRLLRMPFQRSKAPAAEEAVPSSSQQEVRAGR
jgi:sterol desaturase/sphingolipid hydroxylase (fatty acid hydroxylase superfamily)